MNNYEDRTMNHKRVRMDGEGGPGVVQGNGLPLNYMDHLHKVVGHFPADNGHQGYGAAAAYGGGGAYYGGGGGGGEWGGGGGGGEAGAGYGGRGLAAYAPPAHQPYQQQSAAAAAAFLQHQQHLHMQYEQQRHHPLHPQHHPQHHKWPQTIMQPLQGGDQVSKGGGEVKMKQEVKSEPPAPVPTTAAPMEPLNIPQPQPPLAVPVRSATIDSDIVILTGQQLTEDSPKIKIKTDIFKDEATTPPRPPSTTDASQSQERSGGARDKSDIEERKTVGSSLAVAPQPDNPPEIESESAVVRSVVSGTGDTVAEAAKTTPENTSAAMGLDPVSGESTAVDTTAIPTSVTKPQVAEGSNSNDSVNKITTIQNEPESSSSSEDETKIPNDVYFGTPDVSSYRPQSTSSATSVVSTGAVSVTTPSLPEGKKRGRPKGSTNKPKPPELIAAQAAGKLIVGASTPTGIGRGQVGRPRGGGNTSYITHSMRPFKRDFSGIRFRRRWSDDCLDSSHIPNEVYFGDVPVSMEVLYNYYDAQVEREKLQAQQQAAAKAAGGSNNVTLVYSSSDSSSDDSSDSDSSDTDPNNQDPSQMQKRRPGRPRGSKTVNRRSDGPRTPGSAHSPGDKAPGITEMKRFLKAAGVEYDYVKLVDGCTSNKERVAKLLELLRQKGLEGEPTMESCKALYTGPPKGRRGPKPGTKRGPRKIKTEVSDSDDSDKADLKPLTPAKTPKITKKVIPKPEVVTVTPVTPLNEDGARRMTRGQTSGKPRQRIIISSDEEDSHTPLSKLRLKK